MNVELVGGKWKSQHLSPPVSPLFGVHMHTHNYLKATEQIPEVVQ